MKENELKKKIMIWKRQILIYGIGWSIYRTQNVEFLNYKFDTAHEKCRLSHPFAHLLITERVVLNNISYDKVVYIVAKLRVASPHLHWEGAPSAVFYIFLIKLIFLEKKKKKKKKKKI